MNENNTCYICGGSDFQFRKGSVRDDPALKIIECTDCGLVFLSSFDHINEGHYENSGMHDGEPPSVDDWLLAAENDDQRRFEMYKNIITDSVVLDVGAGAGGFLYKAKNIATGVFGIEPEERIRKYWGNRLNLYASMDEVKEKYDLITSFHVIEHLPDPRAMIAEMAEHLKDSGRMVIEVPSSEDALLTFYENESFQNFTYWSQHLYLFSPKTLKTLSEQAGLKVVSIEQFQRYPLSNHLYWLSRGLPDGHDVWFDLDTSALSTAYADSLAHMGKCDTLIAYLER